MRLNEDGVSQFYGSLYGYNKTSKISIQLNYFKKTTWRHNDYYCVILLCMEVYITTIKLSNISILPNDFEKITWRHNDYHEVIRLAWRTNYQSKWIRVFTFWIVSQELIISLFRIVLHILFQTGFNDRQQRILIGTSFIFSRNCHSCSISII